MSAFSSSLTMEEAAIVAAAQASEATAELLRFAREGEYSRSAIFGEDVVCKLAEALKLAIDLDQRPEPPSYLDDDERQAYSQLGKAVATFIEGWAG